MTKPKLTPADLAGLAQKGALNREIAAALGRPMTKAEHHAVDKARAAWKLRRSNTTYAPGRTAAEQKRIERRKDRLIEYATPAPAERKRRKRLEADCAAWLRWFLPKSFFLPFGPVHLDVIAAALRAIRSGTPITVAAPRGFGKTRVLWGVALYAVLTGLARFPVVIGWKQNAGLQLLDQWLEELAGNDRLAAAYPCQCDPFRESTASNRLRGLLRAIDPERRVGANVRKSRGMVILPDVREGGRGGRKMKQAVLVGASMNGSIKGLNVGLTGGESLRPDVALMDDPQDEDTAASETLVKKVIRRIDYSLRSLSGPRRRIAMMAAVTVVERNDVSEQLLTRPGTEAIRCGQVLTWPDGWDDEDSKVKVEWNEWNAVRLEGLERLDGGKAARAYYRKHKKALTKGMQVSWEQRYHEGGEGRPADPDALYGAIWDYFDLGEEAFMSERQNEPVETGISLFFLTPQIIAGCVDRDLAPGAAPEWAQLIVAGTDINPSYGISTVMLAFGNDQRAHLMWYGMHKMHVGGDEAPAAVTRAVQLELARHGAWLAQRDPRPTIWIIDGAGTPQDCVINFCAASVRACGLQGITAFGRAAQRYRPVGRHKIIVREQCHLVSENINRRWIIWNQHYWMEPSQKGWTTTPGLAGSCSICPGRHNEFAEQVCRVRLIGKADMGAGMRWEYHEKPGAHDYADSMAMAYMGAAWGGIGTGGKQPTRPRYVEQRKPKVQITDD